jgi:2-amino-4-hydroxy-6-hydroxymethyldihydropteridine diphosphokinase
LFDLILLNNHAKVMKGIYLGLGSNLGDREANLEQAMQKITEHIGEIVSRSSVYETEPWGFNSSDQFLNMVIEVDTRLRPSGLLGRLLMIESLLGRLRSGNEYSSRTIDIDILLYRRRRMNRASLVIPHPRLQERKFVLVPLCEIAPGIVDPITGKTIAELVASCTDNSKVTRFPVAS